MEAILLKKFKNWLLSKSEKTKSLRLVPLASRVKLKQNFYSINDDRFFSLRIASIDEVNDILLVEKMCYNGETPWNRSALMHEIQYNKNAFYLVMHDLNRPVAFVGSWFVSGEAHITNIATVPDYERQGIATFLIEQLTHIAKEENITLLSLEVRVSNDKAQRLYRKLGFKERRVKKGYYANDHEDALEMTMKLIESTEECEADVQAAK